MAAETQTLNFGPEWLRALSSGGSVTSPPLSPALPKYKLADYRYGREEMLALYVKDNKVPSDLLDKEFLPILQEEPLPPLALVPFTEEEQRNFSMSVNSVAVLRSTGRGGGTVAGAPRGRSSSRGRGRGRGESGFYQRSFDEVEGGFGRGGREMHRSQSWEERGDRRFEKPGRKDPDAPRSAGWREHGERRRRFDFDFRERDEERSFRRVRSGSGSMEDEKDSLPEWCLEDAEEEMGTFDSSGAFLSLKKAPKEPIPEEQELDFRPVEEEEEEGEEQLGTEGSDNEEAKEPDKTVKKESENKEEPVKTEELKILPLHAPSASPTEAQSQERASLNPADRQADTAPEVQERTEATEKKQEPSKPAKAPSRTEEAIPVPHPSPPLPPAPLQPSLPEVPTPSPAVTHNSPSSSSSADNLTAVTASALREKESTPMDHDDEERLKHLEQEAEKIVAYLQDNALDDERLSAKLQEQRAKGVSLPLTHEAVMKWFYKDPQGEIQGPFSNQEMAEWFQAGYFTMSLLVKRGCDESFQPLGEVIKMWGRVPFQPGPSPPPLLGEVDQERLKRQQELALYQMQHLQYQQFLLRQQYAQVLAQQPKAPLTPQQQQQQLAVLLQQFQALKMRSSEQNLITPVTRSMSVPDTGSIWELQPPASQPSGWEGGSVWDLPGDSIPTAPALEQLQQLEKAKAAKLEQERREAEVRAKREEEERKRQEELRRHQEELLRRQEEERKRREEEELARRKQEEALRRQREQEAAVLRQREEEALRRQREEEERAQQEEALRRLEDRRREEEERRQREEMLRKQEEEAARWAHEEEEAARHRAEEEAARLRLEEEERKRKEQELQRQQELLRQRQQQQEALRRLQQQQQQQQLAQMKLPSSSTWGQQAGTVPSQSQTTLSLAEIQKLEEERELRVREEQRRQQQELMKTLHQQQQQQQQKLSGWGNVSKPSVATKSLLEIQQEEARQMQQQQQNRPQNRAHSNLPTNIGSSAWGTINTSPTNQWGADMSSIWSTGDNKNSVGFWDEAAKEVGSRNVTAKNNKSNANLGKSFGVSSRQNKKVDEEEKLLKLFQGVNKSQDGFTQWCEQMLHTLNTANNLDVPTFVSFLKEVESPYEVHDYIRAYLGDTPEAKEFAKQFLERRAKQKASHHQQQQHQQESVWAVNQSGLQSLFQSNHNQQTSFESVQCGKKKKKQKMVRADPSLLDNNKSGATETRRRKDTNMQKKRTRLQRLHCLSPPSIRSFQRIPSYLRTGDMAPHTIAALLCLTLLGTFRSAVLSEFSEEPVPVPVPSAGSENVESSSGGGAFDFTITTVSFYDFKENAQTLDYSLEDASDSNVTPENGSLSSGAIAAIVLAAILGVSVIAALIIITGKKFSSS
ncbi:GRB10-interacting GYF protein 2 isoform X2 [Latimeria chalumnae]|uniref:GRB10-interacting GYF protein 2 isoform X2 n=1 Tax=Latimeria chalumnae TaxID=7897 RepID=UPI00313E8D68